jgi:hypothetical protein
MWAHAAHKWRYKLTTNTFTVKTETGSHHD